MDHLRSDWTEIERCVALLLEGKRTLVRWEIHWQILIGREHRRIFNRSCIVSDRWLPQLLLGAWPVSSFLCSHDMLSIFFSCFAFKHVSPRFLGNVYALQQVSLIAFSVEGIRQGFLQSSGRPDPQPNTKSGGWMRSSFRPVQLSISITPTPQDIDHHLGAISG